MEDELIKIENNLVAVEHTVIDFAMGRNYSTERRVSVGYIIRIIA